MERWNGMAEIQVVTIPEVVVTAIPPGIGVAVCVVAQVGSSTSGRVSVSTTYHLKSYLHYS